MCLIILHRIILLWTKPSWTFFCHSIGECESSQRPLSCSPSLYLAHQSWRTPWSTRGGGPLGAPKPWNALGSESGGCISTTSTWRRQFVVFWEKSRIWGLIEWGGAAAMGNGTSKKNKGAIFIRYDNKVCWSELELVVSMALMMQVHKVEFDRGTKWSTKCTKWCTKCTK